ncbi:MAG: pyridoxal-phosphate dependent enzyme [Proteobacteria bacterium]|nr:pyridoxal-phosphate dependent enzyme [Verrucomicrobiota bacterium]NBU07904.1 pyridoxal-phosphate dependent enzyme [Pseudomonadota bacterium]
MILVSPTLADIRAAAHRIAPTAARTPVQTSHSLDALSGASIFCKCENFQKGGAYKFRGALNAVRQLTNEQARCGVVTHSSGNHATCLALAARERGIPAYIVVPRNAPQIKQRAIAAFGGRLTLCESNLTARTAEAERIQRETGATFIHPYDNPSVIAGQATLALEMFEQVPQLEVLVAPVSGGGLLSGLCLAAHGLAPNTEVWGAEPALADDAFRSLREGKLLANHDTSTVADGLRASLSERTFGIIRQHVRGIVTVSEDQIIATMRLVWERMKLVVEPSGVVSLAAVLAAPEKFRGRRVGVILTGGNVDLDRLPWQ